MKGLESRMSDKDRKIFEMMKNDESQAKVLENVMKMYNWSFDVKYSKYFIICETEVTRFDELLFQNIWIKTL